MTKPLRYDSSICFRLPKDLHLALIEAAGGQENVHQRLRSLITQYVGKRSRERTKRPFLPPPPSESLSDAMAQNGERATVTGE